MAPHYHAILWIDHHEARVVHFNGVAAEEQHLRPADLPRHLHVKAGSPSGTHVTDEPAFYRDVARALESAQEILITGPSTAKLEFVKHLERRVPQLTKRIVGIETLEYRSEGQLVADARHFFAKADRLRPQRG